MTVIAPGTPATPPQRGTDHAAFRVSVIITVYDEEPEFLAEAVESALGQTHAPAEIVVVEDGARRDYSALWHRFPMVRVIRQDNAGLAAARNTGLRAATGTHVLFLDGDDRLTPIALAVNVASLAAMPSAAMAYGGYRFVDRDGTPSYHWMPEMLGPDPYETLLEGNCVEMHCTVLYHRDTLLALGGFAAEFRACEDYEMFLRIARDHAIAYSPEVLAEYRQHDTNMSRDRSMMLGYLLRMYETQRPHVAHSRALRRALRRGIARGKAFYARRQLVDLKRAITGQAAPGPALRGALRMEARMPLTVLSVALRGAAAMAGARSLSDKATVVDYHAASFLERFRVAGDASTLTVDGELPEAGGPWDRVVLRRLPVPLEAARIAARMKPGGQLLIAAPPGPFDTNALHAALAEAFDPATLDVGFLGNGSLDPAAPTRSYDMQQLCTLDARAPILLTASARKPAS